MTRFLSTLLSSCRRSQVAEDCDLRLATNCKAELGRNGPCPMSTYHRAAILFVVLVLLLTACADPSAQATTAEPAPSVPPANDPTTAPTAAPADPPQPTAVPALAKDVLVA